MKKLLITATLAGLFSQAMGQTTNASPYSRFALGDLNPLALAQNAGLGGSTVGLIDSFQVNLLNPASYSFTARHSPIFDFSFTGRVITLSSATASAKTNYANPNNFALVMPFTKRWGVGLGLVTYSNTGYRIISQAEDETLGGTVYTAYTGTGNINRAFLGTSFMLIDNRYTTQNKKGEIDRYYRDQLSLGSNASYLFGDIEKKRQIFLPKQSGMFDAEVANSLYARDFMFDGGLAYRHKMEKVVRDSSGNKIIGKRSQQLTFGVSATLGRDTKFQRSVITRTVSQISASYADTAQYIDSEKGTIYIPARYSFGLTYDFMGIEGSSRYYKLSLTAQYDHQDWTKYRENFPSGSNTDSLRRSRTMHFGVQFIPHQPFRNSGKVKTLPSINYRIGYYVGTQALSLKNQGINTWGVTAGLGIPLIYSASYSMINIGFEYGNRGTTDNGLVLEKYYGFHIGFAFSPSRVERWFIKRRYD